MNSERRKQLSKFLSYVLRHNPEAIDLQIDAHGWANVDQLIKKAKADDRNLDHESIREIINTSEKKTVYSQ